MKTIPPAIVSIALAMSTAGLASAQSGGYPARPIRWIVPFPPGGSVDTLARTVSSPEECVAYLKIEVAKRGKVVKERGMRAD